MRYTKKQLAEHAAKLFPELEEGQKLSLSQEFQADVTLRLIEYLKGRPNQTSKFRIPRLASLATGASNRDTANRFRGYIKNHKSGYVSRWPNVGIVVTPLTEFGYSQSVDVLMEGNPGEVIGGKFLGDICTGFGLKQIGLIATLRPDGAFPTWYSKRLLELWQEAGKPKRERLKILTEHQLTAGGAARVLGNGQEVPKLKAA